MKRILIIDDDVDVILKYKKWLKNEPIDLKIINDSTIINDNFKFQSFDLVMIGFRMSMKEGFDLYEKLRLLEEKIKVEDTKKFKICFITRSVVNYRALTEIHPELGKECYISKEATKDLFINHIKSLLHYNHSAS